MRRGGDGSRNGGWCPRRVRPTLESAAGGRRPEFHGSRHRQRSRPAGRCKRSAAHGFLCRQPVHGRARSGAGFSRRLSTIRARVRGNASARDPDWPDRAWSARYRQHARDPQAGCFCDGPRAHGRTAKGKTVVRADCRLRAQPPRDHDWRGQSPRHRGLGRSRPAGCRVVHAQSGMGRHCP